MTDSLPADYGRFALAVPLYRLFDYAMDAGHCPKPGCRYQLPFGTKQKTGVLLSSVDPSDLSVGKVKTAIACLDEESVVDAHLLELAHWMSQYYLQPIGEVVFQMLPAVLRKGRPTHYQPVIFWQVNPIDDDFRRNLERRSPKQFAIYCRIEASATGLNAKQLRQMSAGWLTMIKALQQKNAVRAVSGSAIEEVIFAHLPVLSDEQAKVVESISSGTDGFSVHLIDGITGSGKTEVYFELMKRCLESGRQVIYLVPEIGLTPQLTDRVRQRFGNRFVVSHSGLTDHQRYHSWEAFRQGDADIMMGTRSCLFSATDKLGLIVIDEEHDHSYRQEDGLRYHARDLAIKRAQMLGISVVLGSATPSLESLHNCLRDHYQLHRLTQRPTAHPPPAIELIDVQHQMTDSGCARQTLDIMREHLDSGGQVLIYLNRRGFAPVVMCHECDWQASCRQCDSRLTWHHSIRRLICHHCGFSTHVPDQCPECDHTQVHHYGMGTEQLELHLKAQFESVPVYRIDRDTIKHRDQLRHKLDRLKEGEPCILIGTQMIAKGHDYPSITLSVILDADQALFSGFYRATEQLAQTVYQVSGRSGRGDRQGRALLQTRYTKHPMMQAIQNGHYRDIIDGILLERKALSFPPFARVVILRADAVTLNDAMQTLQKMRQAMLSLSQNTAVKCIGPMPALMTRRVGRYRAQLCFISSDFKALRQFLSQTRSVLETTASTSRVKWNIDVDPYDL